MWKLTRNRNKTAKEKRPVRLDYMESISIQQLFRGDHPDERDAEEWWRDTQNNLAKKKMAKKYGYFWEN